MNRKDFVKTTGKRNMNIYILNFLRKAEKWQFVWVIEKA